MRKKKISDFFGGARASILYAATEPVVFKQLKYEFLCTKHDSDKIVVLRTGVKTIHPL